MSKGNEGCLKSLFMKDEAAAYRWCNMYLYPKQRLMGFEKGHNEFIVISTEDETGIKQCKVNGSVKHEPLMIKSGVNHFQMEPDCVLNVKELVLSTLPKPLEQIEIHLHPITKVDVGNITGYLSYWKHQEEDALEAIKESLGKWSKHASKIPMEKVLEEIQHAKNHQSYGSKRILNLVLASLALTLIVLLIMFIAKRYWMFKIKKKLPMDQIPMTNNEAGVDTITRES